MVMGDDKSAVMSFAEGFTFLGEDFGMRYPPAGPGGPAEPPSRRVVYVARQGSHVRLHGGRLLVETKDDVRVLDVPMQKVARIVCFGSIGVSAGIRDWAMGAGVGVIFATRRGVYQGQLVSEEDLPRISRVRAQLEIAGTDRGLAIARQIVEAKIAKQCVLLKRFARRAHAEWLPDTVAELDATEALVANASSQSELMGVEGFAARSYYEALGRLMPEGLVFAGRSRQPPRDVVNAALSFGYTILQGECVTAALAAGLDPAVGLLHAQKDRRASLSLDLMEEFRPLIVDQVVMQLARSSSLRTHHGREESGKRGVLLTREGKERLLDAYERRMQEHTAGALAGFEGSWRRHLYRQAQRLRMAIQDANFEWSGLGWR